MLKKLDNKLSWDGLLSFKFIKQHAGIFYYRVFIDYKKDHVEMILPRYAPLVGWIEIFGLPPPNEWVVLDNNDYSKVREAKLVLITSGRKKLITERLQIHTDSKNGWRLIEFERRLAKLFENQLCLEDWSQFKKTHQMEKRMFFKHSSGAYYVTLRETKNPQAAHLSSRQKNFLRRVKKEHGQPSQIWLKQFSAHGDPLPIYNKIFPFWKHLWKKGDGTSLEIGYEKEMHHGDWYKLFELGSESYEFYEIAEGGWSSREVIYQGKKVRIKDTYQKTIRQTR